MTDVDEFLAHYGVKGMKWGVRKKRKLRDSDLSDDARTAMEIRRTAKQSPAKVKSLSNQDIEIFLKRVNLEKRFVDATPGPGKRALNMVKNLLGTGKTMNDVNSFINSPSGQALKKGYEKGKGKPGDEGAE
jgi:hypothetical protein